MSSKTQIWHGGLAEVIAGEQAPATSDTPAQEASTHALPATRIMSIEQLLSPEERTVSGVPAPVPSAPSPTMNEVDSKVRSASARLANSNVHFAEIRGSLKRHKTRAVLYAGLIATLLIMLYWPDTQAAISAPHVVARVPRAAPALEPEVRRAPLEGVSSTLAGKEKGLERRAADALAAGDYGRAAVLYEQLAKTVPEPSPYSEAARILRAAAQ